MKTLLRPVLKKALVYFAKKTIEKHTPRLVAVFGTGQTSIARELTYHLLKEKYPVRRNLESPEAEFSVPLTIIGAKNYPKSYFEWLIFIFTTLFRVFSGKRFEHVLVLELNVANEKLFREWFDILSPEIAYVAGQSPDFTREKVKKIVKLTNNEGDETVGIFGPTVREIGKYFGLSDEDIEKQLRTFQLPKTKIRVLPGKNNSTIVDATYYYTPIKIEAVLDLVNEGIIFTDNNDDLTKIDKNHWKINPENFKPHPNDVIVLRGNRLKINKKFEYLIDLGIPLI